MQGLISVVIPNHNKARTLASCLTALARSTYPSREVIVVDDGSADDSVVVASGFSCRVVALAEQVGAAAARNRGVAVARGEVIFFIDSDCLVLPETLDLVLRKYREYGPEVIIGGTYTEKPFDAGFYSFFQSVFIHYSETKNLAAPDYLATHALAMSRARFLAVGGFARRFLPILEDVEFCHRLRRLGYRLRMVPELQVRHDFGFGLWGSLQNGFRKSRYWVGYSLRNRDLLADSGTASWELKGNGLSFALLCTLAPLALFLPSPLLGSGLGATFLANLLLNRKLLHRFLAAGGLRFGVAAGAYYLLVYPLAVLAGSCWGLCAHLLQGEPAGAGADQDQVSRANHFRPSGGTAGDARD